MSWEGSACLRQTTPLRLTKREIEVLLLAIERLDSQQIGGRLSISPRTVHFHIANLYDKLQVHTRLQAYLRAVRLGLIPAEDAD